MALGLADRRTFYVVQSFSKGRDGIQMDAPIEARSQPSALQIAERIADRKASVMVFARTGDPTTGEFDDPIVIKCYGEALENSTDDIPF